MPSHLSSTSITRSEVASTRELKESDRRAIVAFLISLSQTHRFNRFGRLMSDGALAAYGAQINFSVTRVIGAFAGDALVALAEVSIDEFGLVPCEVVLTPAPGRQGVGRSEVVGQETCKALVKAAIAAVSRLDRTQLLLSFQAGDSLIHTLVNDLVGPSGRSAADGDLQFRVAFDAVPHPLPVLVTNAGDILATIVWNRPKVADPTAL